MIICVEEHEKHIKYKNTMGYTLGTKTCLNTQGNDNQYMWLKLYLCWNKLKIQVGSYDNLKHSFLEHVKALKHP